MDRSRVNVPVLMGAVIATCIVTSPLIVAVVYGFHALAGAL